MKKLFLLLLFCFSVDLSVSAQTKKNIDYHGEFDIGYSFGVGVVSIDRFNFHLINGIMLNDIFSFGLGTGVDGYMYAKKTYQAVPVYLNFKSYIPINDL